MVGGALSHLAILLGIGGQPVGGGLQVLDGELVHVFAARADIIQLQALGELVHDGDAAEALGQAEIRITAEETGLGDAVDLVGLTRPIHVLGAHQGQVRIADQLVEIVPDTAETGIGRRPQGIVGPARGAFAAQGMENVEDVGAHAAEQGGRRSQRLHGISVERENAPVGGHELGLHLGTLLEGGLGGIERLGALLQEQVVLATGQHESGDQTGQHPFV